MFAIFFFTVGIIYIEQHGWTKNEN
jgi:hypothetical protein